MLMVFNSHRIALLRKHLQIEDDGVCARASLYVQVMSRTLEPMPADALARLIQAGRDACLEPGDFKESHHFCT